MLVLFFFFQRVKRQAINEDDAFNICDAAFQQSPHYKTCLQVVPTFSNDTLVNCIRDLTVSVIKLMNIIGENSNYTSIKI